tara:strand:- start:8 stop:541 length:534 start_codon:yes stop_codon:yes gene_type:complete
MSDFCTCGQQKTLELDYKVKEEETEEVLPPVDDTEKAEEEEVEEEVAEEPDEEQELLEEKGYARKDMATLASLLKQMLNKLEGEDEEELEEDEEKEMPMEEEVPMAEPMLEEEEEVSMSVKEALKTLEKSGMSVYAGSKATPAPRRVVADKPIAINWSEFSKSVEEVHRMEERAGVN